MNHSRRYRKKGLLYSFAGLAFAGFASVACAEPAVASLDYFDLSPEQLLNAEIVSASKRLETVSQAATAIYVITNEDIRRSGVTSIPDALRMAPGVQVAQADANSWAVSIRGFNSVLANKLLVLIDGRTIYNPVFGGVLWEAHDLMLEDIERIEVIRGPGGTLWGANAVNGVINILTKRAEDTQGNLVSALVGNEEKGTANIRHGGRFGDDGFYRVYARASDHDTSQKPITGEDTYDEWQSYRSGFRSDWGAGKFTLQGDAYRTPEHQVRTAFSLVAPPVPTRQTIVYEGVNLLGRWTDARADGSQLNVQAYVDWTQRDEPVNFVDNRAIYDLETQYNFAPWGRNELIVGAGYRFLSDHEKNNGNVSFDPRGRRDSLYNAFIQNKTALLPEELFLTLGSKFEHNEFSGFEVQPSARLQWQPNGKQTLWSSVSRAVRTPTPIEEDLTSTIVAVPGAPGLRFAFVPNDDFKSEELIAYEAGYRHQITPSLSADFAVFYNDYDRLQTTGQLPFSIVNNGIDPVHIFVPVQFQNDMQGKTHGYELATSWNATSDLKFTANYSYLRLSLDARLDPTQEGGEDIYPRHTGSLRASWNMNEKVSLDTSAYYVDNLPGFDVDSYLRLDMNLGWKIDNGLIFNLVGRNLIDSAHREFSAEGDANAGEIERSVFGKLTWDF